jgi:hypothetical protein
MTTRTFRDLISHLKESGIASPADLKGCSSHEITALEERYNLKLPVTYLNYLATMGHGSGRLFTHDHYAATYEHVLSMTAQYRGDCLEFPDEPHVELPPDALIIVGRLDEQFLMIRCNSLDESPVWYFNECETGMHEPQRSLAL